MLHPALDLFLLAAVERPSIRAAEITAYPASHRDLGGVMVATFGAGEPLAGTFEFTGKATLVAFVDGGVGAVIGDPVVAVVPDVFQGFQIVLDIWIFAVADETTTG